MNKSYPEKALERMLSIDAGILRLLDERISIYTELKEWRVKNGQMFSGLGDEDIISHIRTQEPDLSIADEKILLLWGKIVELTGSAHSD